MAINPTAWVQILLATTVTAFHGFDSSLSTSVHVGDSRQFTRRSNRGHSGYLDHESHGSELTPGIDLSSHPWIPASRIYGAQRSPCPLLNTLANHGFLPRNGLNINMDTFNAALIGPLNLHPDFASILTTNAFKLLGLLPEGLNHTNTTINLETLNNYTTGNEHDASLTRLDHIQSPELTPAGTPRGTLVPNKNLIHQLLSDLPGPYITTRSLGKSCFRRERDSLAAGSPLLRPADKTASFREAGLLVQFIGEGHDPNDMGVNASSGTGAGIWDRRLARKDRVAEWLVMERFPEGWKRTGHPITVDGDVLPLAERVEYWRNITEAGCEG